MVRRSQVQGKEISGRARKIESICPVCQIDADSDSAPPTGPQRLGQIPQVASSLGTCSSGPISSVSMLSDSNLYPALLSSSSPAPRSPAVSPVVLPPSYTSSSATTSYCSRPQRTSTPAVEAQVDNGSQLLQEINGTLQLSLVIVVEASG